MQKEGIHKIEEGEIPALASVLYRAFQADEPLRRSKYFPPELFPDFFSMTCDFLFSGKGATAVGFWQEGRLLGAALGICSSWNAPASILWGFFRRSWRILGPASLLMIFNLLRAAWLSRPGRPLWRLLFIGVLPEMRGRGLARLILRYIFSWCPAEQIQLEVERANVPAFELYLSEGFRPEREYRLGGVQWLVMVKNLVQEQKPN